MVSTKRCIERNPTLTIESIKSDPLKVKDIDVFDCASVG